LTTCLTLLFKVNSTLQKILIHGSNFLQNLLATNRSHCFKFFQIPISWLNVGRGLCVVLNGRNYPHNAYIEAFQVLYCYWSTTTLLVVFLDHQFPFQIRYRCLLWGGVPGFCFSSGGIITKKLQVHNSNPHRTAVMAKFWSLGNVILDGQLIKYKYELIWIG